MLKSKNRVRQLHFVGACSLVPRVDYHEFEIWGDVMPPGEVLTGLCPKCFRGQPDLADAGWKRELDEAMASSASSGEESGPEEVDG